MLAFYPIKCLTDFFTQHLSFYSYQNYIEVSFFIFTTYNYLTWLKQDHTKKLLLHSYMFFALLLFSYYSSCTILFYSMLISAPILIIFSIIIHQRQIQKNFIVASSKYVTISTIPHKNWLESLIRSCLLFSYQKKQILCIVQRSNDVSCLLEIPFQLNLAIQQEIINLILSSSSLHNPTMLLADKSGILRSINVKWNANMTDELLAFNNNEKLTPHDEAITLLTKKTDAFVFLLNTSTNQHAIWYQGTCLKQITIQQLLTCCNEILSNVSIELLSHEKKGIIYAQKQSADHTSPTLY